MFNAESENDLLQCPYDVSHHILRKHFQIHLLRCKKNHPEVEVVKCPFNVTHLMQESDLSNHVATCPDRKLLSVYFGPVVDENVNKVIKGSPDDSDEDWDTDNNSVPDFQPGVFTQLTKK